MTVAGDMCDSAHCRALVDRAIEEFGKLDVLVNNAAFQMTRPSIEDIPDEEFERTFQTNVNAVFYLTKAAVPHMGEGASIINTSSVNSDQPKPPLLASDESSYVSGARIEVTGGTPVL